MAWYNASYLNRRKITINHTKVSGNQTSFPVHLGIQNASLKTVANGGKVQNANGYDIVFTLGETALQWFDIEKYDGVNGIVYAWVGLASLSSTSDTIVYIYYNNASISSSQGDNRIWNDYVWVHHLQTLTDSTGNGHNLTFHGTSLISTGQIDGAQQLTGSSGSYFNMATSADQNVKTNALTVSAWAYSNSDWSSNSRTIFARNQYNIYSNSGNIHWGVFMDGGAERWTEPGGLPSANAWHKYDMVFYNGVLTCYIDGAQVTSYTGSNVPLQASNDTTYIGQRSALTNSTGWNGYLDDMGVCYVARSAGYILTRYNFEKNSASCYTLGPEELGGTIVHRNAMGRTKIIGQRTRNARGVMKFFAPTSTYTGMGRVNIRSSSKHGMGRIGIPNQYLYVLDTFNRANNASSWGNTSYGNIPYYKVAGIGKPSINNNVGFITYGGNANDTLMAIGLQTLQNAEIKTKMRLGSNGGEQMGVFFRYLDPNNYYKFSTGFTRNTSYFWSRKAGKWTTLLTMSTPANVGDWVWVKIRYYGSTFSLKFWHDGQPEPLNWMWVKTDTALTAAGRYGIEAVPAISSPGASFDYVEVDPLTTRRRASGRLNYKQAFPTVWSATGRMNVVDRTANYFATGRMAVDIAPKPTPTGLFVTVGSNITPIIIDSITITEHINQRTTCQFSVRDDVIYIIAQEQAISIYADGILLFGGFVDTIATDHLHPSITRLHATTSKDMRYLADKLIYTGDEYTDWMGGDIVCDLIDTYLKYEGVFGLYAKDTDQDTPTFSQGVLTNMDASSGALQLAAAGADVSILESTTADFSTGTLTNAVAMGDNLVPVGYLGMMMSGDAVGGANTSATGAPNIYNYFKIWRGTAPALATGDYFTWTTWVSTASPEINGGIDFLCSDGTTLRDNGGVDQNTALTHPGTSLQGFADDMWYTRRVTVPTALVGKTIVACLMALEGNTDGSYAFYVHDINLYTSGGVLKQSFQANTAQQISNVGYMNVVVQQTTMYLDKAVRVSPAYDISGLGILKNSFVSWDAVAPTQPTGKGSYNAQVTVEVSLNGGATWAECSNHAPIPTAIAGQVTTALTAIFRQTLRIGGPDPTQPSILNDCQFTFQSAPASSKTDVWATETTGNMGTGTLSMLTNGATGLYMQGAYKSWTDSDVTTGQTPWSTGNAAVVCNYYQLSVRNDQGTNANVQFVFAGQHQNFVAEIDVDVGIAGCEYGMVYRTTFWVNANNTFAYSATITSTQIILARCANGATGSYTVIQSVPHTFTLGNWYRLKVSVFGNNHRVFVDDILYINQNDSTFPNAGYLGARHYNGGTSGRQTGFFDNFGVQDIASAMDYATGNRLTVPITLTDPNPIIDSYMSWDAGLQVGTTLDIQVSLDNGATFTSCTNATEIPGLLPGTITAGMVILFKIVMNSNNPTATPTLRGWAWKIVGHYSATGMRVSPPLDLTPVGRAGNSSVAWDSTSPDGTSIVVSVSIDDANFVAIGNGNEIPQIESQPYPVEDDFSQAAAAGTFTVDSYVGGIAPTVTRDTTAQTVTVSGGSHGVITWDAIDEDDLIVEATLNFSDNGGLVARYRDSDNHNRMLIYDDANGSRTPMIVVANRVAGNDSEYAVVPVDFVRGTYHTVRWTFNGENMIVNWDGIDQAYLPNNALTASGKVGLYNDTGTSVWNDLVVRAYGDSVAGTRVWSQVTMTTTDPTVTPVMRMLNVAARDASIAAGIQMPKTSYVQKTVASALDDVASQGNCWWKIGNTQGVYMQMMLVDKEVTRAPWPLTTNDLLYAQPKLHKQSPLYRNRQYVTGAIDHVIVPETKRGDGITQSWSLTYPVDEIETITINNMPATFGIKDKDTGKQFYYSIGSNTLAQDAAASPVVDGQKINISYKGQVPYTAMKENQDSQKQLALMTKTSGIVAMTEAITGSATKDAADALAQARIDEYCILSRDWEFSTERQGLAVGQVLLVFVPEVGIPVGQFHITQIKTNIFEQSDGSLFYRYDVVTSEGPDIGSWTKWFVPFS